MGSFLIQILDFGLPEYQAIKGKNGIVVFTPRSYRVWSITKTVLLEKKYYLFSIFFTVM